MEREEGQGEGQGEIGGGRDKTGGRVGEGESDREMAMKKESIERDK